MMILQVRRRQIFQQRLQLLTRKVITRCSWIVMLHFKQSLVNFALILPNHIHPILNIRRLHLSTLQLAKDADPKDHINQSRLSYHRLILTWLLLKETQRSQSEASDSSWQSCGNCSIQSTQTWQLTVCSNHVSKPCHSHFARQVLIVEGAWSRLLQGLLAL